MPVYNIYMDPVTVKSKLFKDSIQKLSQQLSSIFPVRSTSQWETYISSKRQQESRYVKLAEEISFTELQKLKRCAIFNQGKYAGGLIYEQRNYRKMPLGKIA